MAIIHCASTKLTTFTKDFQTTDTPVTFDLPSRLDGVRVLVLFGGSHLYGQGRANLEVFRSLAPLGLKARFLTSRRFGREFIEPELNRLGFEWTRAHFGYQWGRYMLGRYFYYVFINLFSILATSWTVWQEIRRWRPTHLYAPNWSYLLYAWLAVVWSRLPLIYRNGEEFPSHSLMHRSAMRQIAHSVSRLICISQFLASGAVKAGFHGERIEIIYNHPPVRGAATALSLAKQPADSVVLLYVGQMVEGKGIRLLVEASVELIRSGRNVCLWLAGKSVWGDPLQQELEQAVITAGVQDRIRFFGFVENVPALFQSGHLHICPSLWPEGLTNVVLEAKQAGVPSVVFPVGGMPELIEYKVDGYVCAAVNQVELTRGIRWFLDDPSRMTEAGRRARASLDDKFGQARFVRQWTQVFESTKHDR